MSTEPPIVIRCPDCRQHLVGKNHGSYERRHAYETHSRSVLLSCPKCGAPFLVTQDDEDFGEESEVRNWGTPRVLYPASVDSLDASVPSGIAGSYLEARLNYDNAAYTSAAFMCRRTLEGICSDRGAGGKNLKSKLLDLKTKGVIEPRLHEWADEVLRELGNDAAHDVERTISKTDAQDALEFTKAIIEYLYVFQAAYERFKQRRQGGDSATDFTFG